MWLDLFEFHEVVPKKITFITSNSKQTFMSKCQSLHKFSPTHTVQENLTGNFTNVPAFCQRLAQGHQR